jgi:hypothetical protein
MPSFYDVNHTHLPSSCDAEIITQNTKNSQLIYFYTAAEVLLSLLTLVT